VPDLEPLLLGLTLAGLVFGSWGILWARTARAQRLMVFGHGLFLATLLGLGASTLVAAFYRADGLVPLGLLAGSLVVGMFWESPRPREAEPLFFTDEA
jgi:hypothetical protein